MALQSPHGVTFAALLAFGVIGKQMIIDTAIPLFPTKTVLKRYLGTETSVTPLLIASRHVSVGNVFDDLENRFVR